MSQTPQRGGRGSGGLFLTALLVGVVAIGFAIFLRRAVYPSPRGGLGPGSSLPAIKAAGWLNGPGPADESLKGSVLVVDAWAHWCGPCLAEVPHLVSAYDTFHDRGVVFIGLTGDPADQIDKMKQFLEKGKIRWPCGYGAIDTLQALQTKMIPQVWVVGTDGRIRWNLDSQGSLEDAIEDALASPGKVSDNTKARRDKI